MPAVTNQRINIVLPERSMERLEELKAKTDAASLAEVIKKALMTFESIADHLAKGAVFFMSMPNGEQVAVDFLIDVKRRKPALRLVSDNAAAPAIPSENPVVVVDDGKAPE